MTNVPRHARLTARCRSFDARAPAAANAAVAGSFLRRGYLGATVSVGGGPIDPAYDGEVLNIAIADVPEPKADA